MMSSIQIRVGYELLFECPAPTPIVAMLTIHSSRVADIVVPDAITTAPPVPIRTYRDSFGNWCTRIVAPPGETLLSADALVNDPGTADVVAPWTPQISVDALPDDTLQFLLPSRYCESDRLSPSAWELFGAGPSGWGRVQAICDFVHRHVAFGYEHARPTKTAWDAFQERTGVCRDFAHLAIALCRCMAIPARYCTGYLGDIGVAPSAAPMDFSGWFEAYLEGGWYTFDARHNAPRIGRVLIARGRDAADVALTTSFGPNTLKRFKVWTEQN